MKTRIEDAICGRCGNGWLTVVFDDGESRDYDCPKCGAKTMVRLATTGETRLGRALMQARSSMRVRHRMVLNDFVEHVNSCASCRGGIQIEGRWAHVDTGKMCPVGQALGVPAGRIAKFWGIT